MGAGRREERRHSLWLWQLTLNTVLSFFYFWTRLQELSLRYTQCREWIERKELTDWSPEAWVLVSTCSSATSGSKQPRCTHSRS